MTLSPFIPSSWGLPPCSRSFLVNIQYRRLYQSMQSQYLRLLTTQVRGQHSWVHPQPRDPGAAR